MPPKAWNEDLVQALRAKASEQEAKNASCWHLWQRAAEAVLKVKKDIKICQSGSIQNLPKESSEFRKTAKDYCEIMRSGRVPQLIRPDPVGPANGEHPYLRNMTRRGGGYAILRALWDAEKSERYQGSLTIDQICRSGQRYCDVPMNPSHWEGRDHGHGWESNKSLLSYRLIERDKAGKNWNTGFRGPKDRISLTQDGRDFIRLMLQKFGDEDDGQPEAPAPPMNRVVKGTKKSEEDEEELARWLSTAAIGAEKEFQVGNDRRKYLHRRIDDFNLFQAPALGYRLEHDSHGDGRLRTLIVKKVGMAGPSNLSSVGGLSSSLAGPLLGGIDGVSSAGPAVLPAVALGGEKLGGRQSTHGKREASAMAAERRMSAASMRGIKKPRTAASAAPAAPPKPPVVFEVPKSPSSSSSDSDSEEDEEMKKAIAASLLSSSQGQDEDRDLGEAMRLSLESASSQDGPPARFAQLSPGKSFSAAASLNQIASSFTKSCVGTLGIGFILVMVFTLFNFFFWQQEYDMVLDVMVPK